MVFVLSFVVCYYIKDKNKDRFGISENAQLSITVLEYRRFFE